MAEILNLTNAAGLELKDAEKYLIFVDPCEAAILNERYTGGGSPDRVDALMWIFHELLSLAPETRGFSTGLREGL